MVHGHRNGRPPDSARRVRSRGFFLIKASIEYKANEAVGLDGALAKLYDGAYGSWLLGAVAAGLVAFAAFSIGVAPRGRMTDRADARQWLWTS